MTVVMTVLTALMMPALTEAASILTPALLAPALLRAVPPALMIPSATALLESVMRAREPALAVNAFTTQSPKQQSAALTHHAITPDVPARAQEPESMLITIATALAPALARQNPAQSLALLERAALQELAFQQKRTAQTRLMMTATA